jgi:lysophospholipid acyltransferase
MDVSPIANALNTDEDTARFLVGILLTFPMGYIMSFIPFGASKHTFAAIGGLYLLRMTMGDQWFHIPLTTIISYLMLWKLPRNVSRYAVPVFAMAYCSYTHIMRQFYGTFDFSCPQMMLTIKLYTIVWNLWDGQCIQQNRELSRATKNNSNVALAYLPSFLDFLGYCLNFATVLVGPAYEFHYYKNVCDGNYVLPYYNRFGRLPSRWIPVLFPLATSVGCAIYYATLVGNYDVINNPNMSAFGHIIAF